MEQKRLAHMNSALVNRQHVLQVLMLLALAVVGVAHPPSGALVEDPHLRAVRLVAQMTLDEKLGFIQGCKHAGCAAATNNGSYVGIVPGLPRLGIPDLRMNDGPEGFRGHPGTSTQWPSGLTVAHSWDLEAFADGWSEIRLLVVERQFQLAQSQHHRF